MNKISKAQQLKERIDKWDCIQLKSFYIAKEAATTLKRYTAE
jgi:hypothetical protein